MAQGPKCVFADLKEAKMYLREWQERLFLQDWIISLEFDDSMEPLATICATDSLNVADIKMVSCETYGDICKQLKFCHEKILVHELLHIALRIPSNDEVQDNQVCTHEVIMFDALMHQRVEKMAKSLIMAKYNIGFDWFRND